MPGQPAARTLTTPRGADLAAFAAGAIAALVAIAVGELIAGLVRGAPSLVIAIADLLVDLQPAGAKQLMVELFGDADKMVVDMSSSAPRRSSRGSWAWPAAARSGCRSSASASPGPWRSSPRLRQPLTEAPLAVVTVVAAVARRARRAATAAGGLRTGLGSRSRPRRSRRPRHAPRCPTGIAAASSSVAGRSPQAPSPWVPSAAACSRPRPLPTVAAPVPGAPVTPVEVPPGAALDVAGITPIVVPNDRFYRIDTAFVVPRVDVSTWTLSVKGMVDTPVTLTYDQLAAMPQFEQYVTIACVSNDVGGKYVGNALWRGVDLREVLAMAGVQDGATQIVGRSVDDLTAGFPTAWAMDPSRRPMIALAMNGEPLPVRPRLSRRG